MQWHHVRWVGASERGRVSESVCICTYVFGVFFELDTGYLQVTCNYIGLFSLKDTGLGWTFFNYKAFFNHTHTCFQLSQNSSGLHMCEVWEEKAKWRVSLSPAPQGPWGGVPPPHSSLAPFDLWKWSMRGLKKKSLSLDGHLQLVHHWLSASPPHWAIQTHES